MIKSFLKLTSFFYMKFFYKFFFLSWIPFIRRRVLLEDQDFSDLSVKRCLFKARNLIEKTRYSKSLISPFGFNVQVKMLNTDCNGWCPFKMLIGSVVDSCKSFSVLVNDKQISSSHRIMLYSYRKRCSIKISVLKEAVLQ